LGSIDTTFSGACREERRLSNRTLRLPGAKAHRRLRRALRGRPDHHELGDRELMALAKSGDSTAFGEIFERHVDGVFAYVKARVGDASLAEDLTQDCFVSAFRAVGRFHWQGQVMPWLLSIAHNRVANHWRALGRRPEQVRLSVADWVSTADHVATGDADPHVGADAAYQLQRVADAAGALSDAEREVIALRFGLELSVPETAAVMQRSETSVRSLQYRAVKRFRDLLATEDGET